MLPTVPPKSSKLFSPWNRRCALTFSLINGFTLEWTSTLVTKGSTWPSVAAGMVYTINGRGSFETWAQGSASGAVTNATVQRPSGSS